MTAVLTGGSLAGKPSPPAHSRTIFFKESLRLTRKDIPQRKGSGMLVLRTLSNSIIKSLRAVDDLVDTGHFGAKILKTSVQDAYLETVIESRQNVKALAEKAGLSQQDLDDLLQGKGA